ncbi:tol-pal system-associated acyl-CoA thioesterase [Cobetia sp. L2A1]|uniref:tol-pal system-associated acyl-CoA thioesterase n=1 Tax=Cobetia sp. L2A1 TaxID=2686360 RepID=UPI001E4BF10A|nr:tol-pal system-associated acyl-CoA thioesterase [Cobetia sp. L2A1]
MTSNDEEMSLVRHAPCFRHIVRVYIEDTDAGGIVYYVNYLRFMERARSEWLRERGFSQQALLEKGIQLVVHSVTSRYLRPAYLDDLLTVTASAGELRGARLNFQQQAFREDALLCEAEVIIACVDAVSFRPRRWPVELLSALDV